MIDLPWEKKMVYLNPMTEDSIAWDILTLDTIDLSWQNDTQLVDVPADKEFSPYYQQAVFLPLGPSGVIVALGSADEVPEDLVSSEPAICSNY